jgi:hypothetical protein
MGQMEAHFGTFGVLIFAQDRCTVWDEHTKGSKIILFTLDGTPK